MVRLSTPADAIEGTRGCHPAFSYYRRLDRVRESVLDDLSKPWRLSDAARVAHMERTAFSAFFHRKTDQRFRDWLAAERVARAKRLMSEHNLSVRDVSTQVGCANVRTFERMFRRVTGQCPIDYKTSVRPS